MQKAGKVNGLFGILDKTEFMSFKVDCAIFSLNAKSWKSIEQFVYLRSNISSTEITINMYIGKA